MKVSVIALVAAVGVGAVLGFFDGRNFERLQHKVPVLGVSVCSQDDTYQEGYLHGKVDAFQTAVDIFKPAEKESR